MKSMKVAIVGGGPAGLVTLKTLLEHSTAENPIEAALFESEADIGGTLRYRGYQNAELVSSKQLTAFSDHRFPSEAPDHVSLPAYVDYLQSYIDRFRLSPHINLSTRVVDISPTTDSTDGSRHTVRYQSASGQNEIYKCTHLAICTGLHVNPFIPKITGIENIQGTVYHSASYKSRSQLAKRDILILGCGETAMDIAYEAVHAGAQSVTMSFRGGFLSMPKSFNRFQVLGRTFKGGLPIDGLITNLFETTYVHHSVRKSRMRWLLSDKILRVVMWFLTGTQEGCNQHVGTLPKSVLGRSYVFLNKSPRAMPYLNRPYKKSQPFLDFIGNKYLDLPEDAESDMCVDTCSWPSHVETDGRVIFQEAPERKDWLRLKDRVVKPDVVIYCTGYRQYFNWLGSTYPTPSMANVRHIVKSTDPDIAYIGFVRPGVGAIPPIAEQQALWWTALILGKMPMPTQPGHYSLLNPNKNPRLNYAVDHGAYISTLGKDFGGEPSLFALWRIYGVRVLFSYCFGAAFVTYYRLLGPFAFPGAADIAETELMDIIMRRGVVGNLFWGLIPMIFYGIINGVALLLATAGIIPPETEMNQLDM